jgi:hypothetical protein
LILFQNIYENLFKTKFQTKFQMTDTSFLSAAFLGPYLTYELLEPFKSSNDVSVDALWSYCKEDKTPSRFISRRFISWELFSKNFFDEAAVLTEHVDAYYDTPDMFLRTRNLWLRKRSSVNEGKRHNKWTLIIIKENIMKVLEISYSKLPELFKSELEVIATYKFSRVVKEYKEHDIKCSYDLQGPHLPPEANGDFNYRYMYAVAGFETPTKTALEKFLEERFTNSVPMCSKVVHHILSYSEETKWLYSILSPNVFASYKECAGCIPLNIIPPLSQWPDSDNTFDDYDSEDSEE